MRRLSAIPLPYVAALVLAAVIGGGIYLLRQSEATMAAPPSVAQSPTVVHRSTTLNPATAMRPNGESSKRPTQILADAASALRSADGFELRGAENQSPHGLHIDILVSGPRSVDMSASNGADAYEILSVPSGLYFRANATYWTQRGGARGAVLADRWIRSSSSTAAAGVDSFSAARLARCLTEDHGTLSVEGTSSVNGQPAVVLKDAGDLPGTQPGTLAVAATGAPYPLRVISTGRRRAGGRADACNGGHAGGSEDGTVAFSHFNQVPPLQPPTHALEVPGPPIA
jgi:hypothetical protein